MTRYKIIANPVAGRGQGAAQIPVIERKLSSLGLTYELARTERPWHAFELTQLAVAQGFDVVVAAGGDGTVNEVLNGLMLAKQTTVGPVEVPPVRTVPAPAVGPLPFHVAMGVLCIGRGNDFAFGANIPTDAVEGCQVLAANSRRKLDVGRIEGGLYPQGRYFGNGVGIGFDAVVGFVAARHKRLSGFASYLMAALQTIFVYYKAPQVRLEYEGRVMELSTLMISIMNGQRMGGGFLMAPQGNPSDGALDLCIARQTSKGRILALIPKFTSGAQAGQPEIQFAQARQVSISAMNGGLPAHADGETICTDGKELRVELLAGQLEVICREMERA
jgi:diacylglycerol kinase family enzyme